MKLFLSLVGFCMQIKLTLSDELEEMVLQIHNQHRIEAGLITLEWNETLAQQVRPFPPFHISLSLFP